MKEILLVHPGTGEERRDLSFLGRTVRLLRIGSGGAPAATGRIIADHADRVVAIGLDGMPLELELGRHRRPHAAASTLREAAGGTPIVDGLGIRAGLERWAITLAERAEPGIFSQKRVLMVPGLNHGGMATALSRRTDQLRYADPEIYFGLPELPGVGSPRTLDQVAGPTLDRLTDVEYPRLAHLVESSTWRIATVPFRWADVVAGDMTTIRRFAPPRLARSTVVVGHADDADLEDLRRRGARIVVTLMPPLDGDDLARHSAAVLEAILVALRPHPESPMTEDTYLDLMAELRWTPAIRYLEPSDASVRRFAFVIHPLTVRDIHRHPLFRWTRFLPDPLVETIGAYLPPLYLSRMTGGRSPATGQRIEGHLFSLAATPRQMLARSDRFTYDRLHRASRMAQRRNARIMGLGAFTSVVGDAGVTVANEADIAVTSGNSLTVATTIEAAKLAVRRMGCEDLARATAMVVGATGSIGSVCARLLAHELARVVLVSIEPEKLIDLKRLIESESPGTGVTIATRAGGLAGDCDLVVTATSAFGQRVVDISRCRPGTVICDVARPPDIGPEEAALRPDVLVIEGGEVVIPGPVDFGFDIGLPPGTAYACLAETALLAMEGRFESFTVGRGIEIDRVREIHRLYRKHQFQLAGLSSFGRFLGDEEIDDKRRLAEALRADPDHLAEVERRASEALALIPPRAKGVAASGTGDGTRWLPFVAAGVGAILIRRLRRP